MDGKKKIRVSIIVALGTFLLIWGWWVVSVYWSSDFLRVTFFDVGQGDSTLIEYKDFRMLIDGGPDNTIWYKLDSALGFFDRKIDFVVLTHPHNDHYFGLIALPDRYRIHSVIIPPLLAREPKEYVEFLKHYKKNNISLVSSTDIKEIQVDHDVIIRILFPQSKEQAQQEKNFNNISAVIQVSYGPTDILFTGDIEEEVEQELLKCCKEVLDSEILKVAHHGSDTSSTVDFLKSVSPEVAIISLGEENPFGHPSARVLFRLSKLKARIFRTDEDGDISVIVEGDSYQVAKNKNL